jgi:hypothetical protein
MENGLMAGISLLKYIRLRHSLSLTGHERREEAQQLSFEL